MAKSFDVIVIGAGPGGYVTAIRAAQLGLSTACIEKEPALGGTCLRVGCIPSKALLEASERYVLAKDQFAEMGVETKVTLNLERMMGHKSKTVDTLTGGVSYLFKKNGITRYEGHGRITGKGQVEVLAEDGSSQAKLEAKHIIIATGSKSAELKGVELDYDRIGTSTEALSYPEVPKHLIVIGAGVIGLELGSVWARLGAKVTVVEYLDRILPGVDAEIAKEAFKLFKKQGITFQLSQRVTGARVSGGTCVVEREGEAPLEGDRVLLCTGRVPNTDGLGLDAVGLETDRRGRIPVDDRYRTSVEGIYAIGDVIAGPMLAHKAEEEGIACVEWIAKGWGHVDYNSIPSVVYTEPEIAWVGRTEEELKEEGVPFKKGSFPYQPNGRAKALGAKHGKVKVLAHAETDRVLGVHIIGARAGDLIAEAAVAMAFGASSEDIGRASHAHPTLAEILKEAALDVSGRALHL